MHYSKHSWDEVLQDFRLLGHNFICNLLHQRQNTLHPIAKARGHLVILVLFFQELNRQTLLLPPYASSKDTPQKWRWQYRRQPLQLGSTTRCQCLSRSRSGWMRCGILTSAKIPPSLNVLSSTFSIGPLIIGVYSSSNLSRSWSDKRRAST